MPCSPFFLTCRQRIHTRILCLSTSVFLISALGAANKVHGQDLFALPLEELLNIQVVTATLEATSIHEAPSIMTVISHEEIQNINPRNITDILNLTPGFNMVVESLHAPLLQLRGTGNRQDNVLLLIDGHRLNCQLFGGSTYVINDIPVELIDHVEIIRGPGSALYGSNAFEAVINLITVPEQNGKQGLIYGKYGTDDTMGGGTTYASTDHDQHLVLSAAGFDSNGPNDPYVDLSAYNGTIEFPQRSKNIYANARQGNWNILALRNIENSGPYIGNTLYDNEGSDREYTTTAIEGSYSRDLNAYGNISLKTYYDEFDYDALWEAMPVRLSPPNGLFKAPTATDARLGGEVIWKKTLFSSHRFLLGSSYDQIKLYNSTLQQTGPSPSGQMVAVPASWIIPEENSHHAFFFQDQFPLFTDSHVTLGGRYDNYDKYGDTFNPRIGFTTPVNADSYIKLLYGTAFRAPSYYESNTTAHGNLVPTTDVTPERLESIEAEYSVTQPQLTWRANTFYTKITDLIETVTVPAGGTAKRNIGTIDSYGLEAEAKKIFFNSHSISINGYWNYAEDEKGDRVLRTPQYGAALILNNKWSETWNTNIQAKYTGSMEKAPVLDSNGAVLAYAEDLPATITCNCSVAFVIDKNITLRGLLYNMFDEPLYSPAPSRLDSAGNMLADFPYQGRFAMLSMEYRF